MTPGVSSRAPAGRVAISAGTALSLVLAFFANAAAAADWVVDHDKSRLLFQPTWEGIPFEGEFREFDASIDFDPANPGSGRFEVTVNMAAADAGGADLNEGMALPEFFDISSHPAGRFVTSAIAHDEGDRFIASGTLTVKGIERPLALPFVWTGDRNRAQLSGEVVIRRTDFDVGTGEWASGDGIGLEVRILFDLLLTPRRA